jgi:hypothetical protein
MKKNILSILSVIMIILVVSTGCKKKGVDEGDCGEKFESALELHGQYVGTPCATGNKKAACEAFKSAANSLLASCSDDLSESEKDNIQDLIDGADCNEPCVKE